MKRVTGRFHGKVNQPVRFHSTLNLRPFLANSSNDRPLYELRGVLVHLDYRNISNYGHYIAYVKCLVQTNVWQWFLMDDERCVAVTEEVVTGREIPLATCALVLLWCVSWPVSSMLSMCVLNVSPYMGDSRPRVRHRVPCEFPLSTLIAEGHQPSLSGAWCSMKVLGSDKVGSDGTHAGEFRGGSAFHEKNPIHNGLRNSTCCVPAMKFTETASGVARRFFF